MSTSTAVDVDDRRPVGGHARGLDDRLGQVHHVVVVAERLVGLEHRELGVVAGVEALVAEDAADLEDPVHAADDQPLQGQLERDPQEHVDVERVVVGDERPRRRAAGLARAGPGVSTSRKPRSSSDAAGRGDHRRALREDLARVVVDDQVEVAAPVAGLGVGEPVAHVGQRRAAPWRAARSSRSGPRARRGGS